MTIFQTFIICVLLCLIFYAIKPPFINKCDSKRPPIVLEDQPIDWSKAKIVNEKGEQLRFIGIKNGERIYEVVK